MVSRPQPTPDSLLQLSLRVFDVRDGSGRKKGPRRNSYDPWSQVKDLLPLRRQAVACLPRWAPPVACWRQLTFLGTWSCHPRHQKIHVLDIRKTDAWVLEKQESGEWVGGIGRPRATWGAFSIQKGRVRETDQEAAPKKAGLRASENVQKSSLVCKNLWEPARCGSVGANPDNLCVIPRPTC